MHEAFRVPIGLRLSQAARTVSRAFDEALEGAGGTLPVWLILLNLKIRKPANQRELAGAVGVREATLTHHLNAMAARGLVTRTRDPVNRRIQVVELTEAGEAAFLRLQQAAIEFDARLRAGLADADLDHLGDLLGQLAANVGSTADGSTADGSTADGSTADGGPPWADLAESRRRQLSVAASGRPVRAVASQALDDGGGGHRAARAHGDQRRGRAAPLEFVQRGGEQPRAGAAHRVAEGDRAAVDVDPV
jgi:MarR family transcriptional regulator, transcriptional regulator for hemolysin